MGGLCLEIVRGVWQVLESVYKADRKEKEAVEKAAGAENE